VFSRRQKDELDRNQQDDMRRRHIEDKWRYSMCISFLSVLLIGALTLLVGRQEEHPDCKKTELWCAGMVICLERDADWNTAQLMPLPLTVCCFSKIQIGFTFLVLAHPGSPRQRAIKWVCVGGGNWSSINHGQIFPFCHLHENLKQVIVKVSTNIFATMVQ